MGLNYQLGERFIPEYRVALNRLNSFTDMQLKLNYILKQKENYQLYTGLGGYYTNDLAKLGVSGGINIYPFKTKDFGFHMEISALFDSAGILKGGWGMQYRFLRSE